MPSKPSVKAYRGDAKTLLAFDLPKASTKNLAGLTNTQVSAAYLTLFSQDKTGAQIMAGALAAYATSSTLSGLNSPGYGFNTSPGGTGTKTYNVGSDGASAGLPNGKAYTVLSLLQAVDSAVRNGSYTQYAKGFNVIFSAINQTGDIN